MKIIVNISMVLVILLSTAAFAAKPKKSAAESKKQPAAESKKTVAEANKPAQEPNKPAAEPNKPAAEPNKPAAEPNKPAAEPNKPAAEPNAPVSEPSAVKDANNQVVVVTVNGTSITESQIGEILNPRMQRTAGRVPEKYREQIRKRVIEQLVIEGLIAQDEKQNNIDVNQSEVNGLIDKQIAEENLIRDKSGEPHLTIDGVKAKLKENGITFSEYQQNIRKRLMFDKLMETKFADKLQTPTDQQIKAYYDENIQQFSKPESIHARHILIMSAEDSNDPNAAKAAAKAKAEDILKKLKAGADFNDLAKQYSACPSAQEGGDLGVQPKGNLVPEFEKAAYALKPGRISDVVQTEFGFHIIKLIEHIDAGTVSFKQARDEIKQVLANKQREQIMMAYVQQIKAGADIKYANEADKLETEITGTKPVLPSRKPTENVQPSDVNKPALETSEKAVEPKKEVDANAPKPASETSGKAVESKKE